MGRWGKWQTWLRTCASVGKTASLRRVSITYLTPMVVHRLLTGLAIIEDQVTSTKTMPSIHPGQVHAADP